MFRNIKINKKPNISYDNSTSNILFQKTEFPFLGKISKPVKLVKHRQINSFSEKRLKTEVRVDENIPFYKKINPKIKLVNILNLEEDVDKILKTDLNLEREKEKIDKNKTIKLIRLGLYEKEKEKEKENNDDKNNNIDNNDNNNNYQAFSKLEKEKENQQDFDKINNENRNKEKKLEKQFKDILTNLEQLRKECQSLNSQINETNKIIEDYQLELSVLNNYAEEYDKKVEEKLNDKKKEEENYTNSNLKKKEIYESPKKRNKIQKIDLFTHLSKMVVVKQKREEKKKLIEEKILIKENIKKKFEIELINKRILYNEVKKDYYIIKKKLINIYHIKLYEGLDFHGEGLSMIIKDIWNLGVNVNISFMPSYLDGYAVDFLFRKARQSIEINNLKQIIKDNEKDLAFYLKDWRKSNKDIKNIFNKSNILGFKNNNNFENKNEFNEKELFKTKIGDISDISISYLESYPKTKKFMIDYKKRHPNIFQREIPIEEIKNISFKSFNIPTKITEKNKYIEKLKNLLEIKIEQNRQKDKKEVERLNKEFIKNNYQERYEVNVETVFGALFGDERKHDMLIYYTKLEKEFRDGKQIIQFHTKLKIKLK